MSRLALILALSLGAVACNPTLYAQSVAPPGRQAKLESIDGFWGVRAYAVELSQGVALAVTCHDGGPCQKMTVVSADPSIADVRHASLANREPRHPYYGGVHQMNSSGFVVLGKAPGKTRIELKSADGNRVIFVTIVAPPPTGAEATRAAALPIH